MPLVRLAMITIVLCCVSACGIRDLTYSNPPVYFAYPSDIAVIKDQSKVATLIVRGGAGGMSIDGVQVINENSLLRSVNKSSYKAAVAIDVLEGTHTIAMRWETSNSVPTSNVVYTKQYSAEVAHYFSAGHTYWISISSQGIHIHQDTPDDIHEYTGIMPDTEFPEYFKQQIINSRNTANF